MTGCCKINIMLHWGCIETLQGEGKAVLRDWGREGGQSVAECNEKGKRFSCKQ